MFNAKKETEKVIEFIRDYYKKNNLGGVIDIELLEENTLYEIKSKSMKDYEEIVKNGNIVQEHQAIHYGLLRDYDKVHIMWIFFDEQTEHEIRNNLPNNDAGLLLNGFFPKMLAKYILDASKLNLKGRKNKDLDDKELEIIASNIKKQKFLHTYFAYWCW